MMKTIEDLQLVCKGGLAIWINEYLGNYETIQQGIKNIPWQPEDKINRMLQSGQIVNMIFYPITPIGSLDVYGTTVQECVDEAFRYLDNK